MDENLHQIKTEFYDKCSFEISGFTIDSESKEYHACQFLLNGRKVHCRNAKVTPKKSGQFVTFWKRNRNGLIEPFDETDPFDFFAVIVRKDKELGQFVFPKSVLISKGILTRDSKEGKRALRVYPPWNTVKSRQAERTQQWQLNFIYRINSITDFSKLKEFFLSN